MGIIADIDWYQGIYFRCLTGFVDKNVREVLEAMIQQPGNKLFEKKNLEKYNLLIGK